MNAEHGAIEAGAHTIGYVATNPRNNRALLEGAFTITVGAAGASATEGAVAVSVGDAEAVEGTGAALAFAVTLSRASEDAVLVDAYTVDGTATAGNDYAAVSRTLLFQPGETVKTVEVAVLDDGHDDDGGDHDAPPVERARRAPWPTPRAPARSAMPTRSSANGWRGSRARLPARRSRRSKGGSPSGPAPARR